MSEVACGLGMLADAYTDVRLALGMARLRIESLEKENTEACAQAERVRQAYANETRERMQRAYKLHRLEHDLAELRGMLYQFVSATGADKETARSFLLAEAVSYRKAIDGK